MPPEIRPPPAFPDEHTTGTQHRPSWPPSPTRVLTALGGALFALVLALVCWLAAEWVHSRDAATVDRQRIAANELQLERNRLTVSKLSEMASERDRKLERILTMLEQQRESLDRLQEKPRKRR